MKGQYRFIKYRDSMQGCTDVTEPLTEWKPINLYSETELNKIAKEYNLSSHGWDEIRIETRIIED